MGRQSKRPRHTNIRVYSMSFIHKALLTKPGNILMAACLKITQLLEYVICFGIEHVNFKYQSKLFQKLYKYYTHTLGEYCYRNSNERMCGFHNIPNFRHKLFRVNERKRYYTGMKLIVIDSARQHCGSHFT